MSRLRKMNKFTGMINQNELRLGNLCWDIHSKELLEVTALSNEGPVGFTVVNRDKYPLQDGWQAEYIPLIPLTLEWLEIFGFKKDRAGWHLTGTQFSLTEQFYPCWLDRMLWPQDIPDFKRLSLKYVHQLQNLYFALTGEELTIKEKV